MSAKSWTKKLVWIALFCLLIDGLIVFLSSSLSPIKRSTWFLDLGLVYIGTLTALVTLILVIGLINESKWVRMISLALLLIIQAFLIYGFLNYLSS